MLLGTFCSLLRFFGLCTLFGDLNEDPMDGKKKILNEILLHPEACLLSKL
jgi:hypothetical protein